ncbi:uncharacterized protein LOC133183211 [Saccostrea echinata]|uniref:uncharacterized protein LOC133183211 n=1 Tax=Saccostrea echinata TaxID=191078 RepID=UPI002A7ED9A9|nr:uncharacterized protein LOC133183211 [Saccostrea echinata]
MVRFTVPLLLFAFVSCQKYPGYKNPRGSPALDLLTGGVSEFIVDGRTYGTDLPPLLTGEASFRRFEESRFRRPGDFKEQFKRSNSFNVGQGGEISFQSPRRSDIYPGGRGKNSQGRKFKNIPWAPRPIPSKPFNPILSNGNFRSSRGGEWNTLNIGGRATFPYTSGSLIPRHSSYGGSDFSGAEYPEIKDDEDFKFRHRNTQRRGFGTETLNTRKEEFSDFPYERDSFGTSYPVDDSQTKFSTRRIFGRNPVINLPKPVDGIFDNFGIDRSEIIHGDDLVSFGRTRGTNVLSGIDRSFQTFRTGPRAYQSDGSSFSRFDATGVNNIQPEFSRQNLGGGIFENNGISELPRVGRIPTVKKY